MSRWRLYNPSPAGRNVCDSAVWAIAKALALGTDWETAYALIALNGYLMGDIPSSNSVWGAVLRQNEYSRRAIPNSCLDCYTIENFAEDHPEGTYVVGTEAHVVTVKGGAIWDS